MIRITAVRRRVRVDLLLESYMKFGLMISVGIVALFGVILFYSMQGSLDAPTRLTAPETLIAVTLPPDPPALTLPPSAPGDTDAAALYQQALTRYREQETELSQSPPPSDRLEPFLALLEQAAQAERVTPGFLDHSIPVAIDGEPAWGDALESIYLLAMEEADRRHEAGDVDGAVRIARAIWTLGRRAFEDNVRLYNRIQGLRLMGDAIGRLSRWLDPAALDTEALSDVASGLSRVRAAWEPKLRIVVGTDPPIGDLINLARHDQDRTFRVAATLRLGVARFKPGTRSNLRAINKTLDDAQASSDPLLAEAGRWAANLTLEEMKRLR